MTKKNAFTDSTAVLFLDSSFVHIYYSTKGTSDPHN